MSHPNEKLEITEIRPDVHFVEGPASNWIVLRGEESVTLIDTGYPEDLDALVLSMNRIAEGRPLSAILITHGHSDHIGGVPELVARYSPEVWAAEEEIPNIKREELHQVGVSDLVPKILIPRYARWTLHAIRAGGLRELRISDVRPLIPDVPTQFSGHTIIPRLTPGHTPGHLMYELPEEGLLATGDALITGHATSTSSGLQALPAMWHWDAPAAFAVAQSLFADRRTILPGHGPIRLATQRNG